MKSKREIVEYKTGLPLDKDIRDTQTHISDQEKEQGHTLKMGSDAQKSEPKKDIKDKTKLQTNVDVRSDPAFNSDDGYETRYSLPSDPKEIVQYKTG